MTIRLTSKTYFNSLVSICSSNAKHIKNQLLKMVPVSNEIAIFNFDANGNPTTPHQMKNTTLACSLCFIQEKTANTMLEHHHKDHGMKFLSEENVTLKNFFTISCVNQLYACEDNNKRQHVGKIAILLESPVIIYCGKCGKFPRNPQRAIDHLHNYHRVKKNWEISNHQDVSLRIDCNDYDDIKTFCLYVVKQPNYMLELGEYKFEKKKPSRDI